MKRKSLLKIFVATITLTTIFTFGNAYAEEFIVDNGQSGTSSSGTWNNSGGANPYGSGSIYAWNTATYIWHADLPYTGTYNIYVWWTDFSNRSTSAPYTVTYDGGSQTFNRNQRVNGGQWNLLGTFSFNNTAGGTVRLNVPRATSTYTTYSADAVKFVYIAGGNISPTATINSITPNPATPGENASFSGSGTDPDGTISAYHWRSSIDWTLSTSASFNTSTLSEGTHTIYFKVQDDDGEWSIEVSDLLTVSTPANIPPTATINSITPNPATPGENVSFSGSGTDPDGTISAYHWRSSIDWTLSSAQSFNTSSLSEGVHTIYFSVQDNDGEWSSEVDQQLTIGTLSEEFIVDNGQTGTSSSGTWKTSSGVNPYGSASIYAYQYASYSWHANLPYTGVYNVYAWWTEFSNRSTVAPLTVTHMGGSQTVNVNQRTNGGQWNLLGAFSFNGTTGGTVTLNVPAPPGTYTTYCADAVKFVFDPDANIPPTATINSITPNPADPGENVSFSGSGTDPDGTVVAYSWRSSIDWTLSTSASFNTSTLSEGTHTIYFKVQDNDGEWSTEASTELVIGLPLIEVIINNNDPGTSYTGSWSNSSAPDPYGLTSLFAFGRSSYTWHVNLPHTGFYKVYAWWTEYFNRSTVAPLTIIHRNGSDMVTVNQMVDGGRWNLLGIYPFEVSEGGKIRLNAESFHLRSYCADAIRFVYIYPGTNVPPVANIDSIHPNPAQPGENVELMGFGEDLDGTITAYNWRSDIDGDFGSNDVVNTSGLSEGTHTIYFKVRDDQGDWSEEVNLELEITNDFVNTEHIYLCLGYAPTSMRGEVEDLLTDMGAYQDGLDWIYHNIASNKSFIIHIVDDKHTMKQALRTIAAHVIYVGHANYGSGAVYATDQEITDQLIEDIYFRDDDRYFMCSSKWARFSLSSMRTSHAFPHLWPEFQDGESALAPYDFGDPRGDPAHNYYLKYQVPGDPNYYKVETVRNSAIQRFSDSDAETWDYTLSGGLGPDSSNPAHHQYYITNLTEWSPSIEKIGDWQESNSLAGFFNEGYRFSSAGSGENKYKFIFKTPFSGNYKVFARWPQAASNTTTVPYIINHSSGSTTVYGDQTANGNQWNQLGEFYFNQGENIIELNNNTASGNVIADAVRMESSIVIPEVLQANINMLYQDEFLTMEFEGHTTGEVTSWLWDFGDGQTNTTELEPQHTYASPGTYTVSFTVYGPLGSNTMTKEFVAIGGGTPEPLEAEFEDSRSGPRIGCVPLAVVFDDDSSGRDGASYLWTFGDGNTSIERNATHTYETMGNYTVSLTVTNADGTTSTEIKPNFVRVTADQNIDDADYPMPHYGNNIVVFRRDPADIVDEEMRYSRMFYLSCNTGIYYIDTFHRGKMFYSVDNASERAITIYLQSHLEGDSDQVRWQKLQDFMPVWDYYDFTKTPAEQE
ncbi:MAG: PKD domain-containing protein [Candidatus Omnitrophota bacterium]